MWLSALGIEILVEMHMVVELQMGQGGDWEKGCENRLTDLSNFVTSLCPICVTAM